MERYLSCLETLPQIRKLILRNTWLGPAEEITLLGNRGVTGKFFCFLRRQSHFS